MADEIETGGIPREKSPEEIKLEKQKIKEQRRQLKRDEQAQKKEVRQRAKEIAKQEDNLADEDAGSPLGTVLATLLIILLWLGVVIIIVKLDIGGFGSTVLKPVLEDVPVVNLILPGVSFSESKDGKDYGGYKSLKDAVEQIRALELQVEDLQISNDAYKEQITQYRDEITNLRQYKDAQSDLVRVRNEFYEEVVYSDKAPGVEEFMKYYEAMDPETAQFVYKQVVIKYQENEQFKGYVEQIAQMKPKAAAAALEAMAGDMALVARILSNMDAEAGAKILDAMTPEFSAKVLKLMVP